MSIVLLSQEFLGIEIERDLRRGINQYEKNQDNHYRNDHDCSPADHKHSGVCLQPE